MKITKNQFNRINIYTIFTQQQDIDFIQVPIDCKQEALEHIQDHKTKCKNFMI